MAVVQMQRINICALKKNRKAILERLQEIGAIEIDIRLEDESVAKKQDVSGSRALFERRTQTADQALDVLQHYAPQKTGMLDSFAGKPLYTERKVFQDVIDGQEECMATASKILSLDRKIAENRAGIAKLTTQMEALVPWLSLPVPVSYSGSRSTAVMIGTVAGAVDAEGIYGILAKGAPQTDALDVQIISNDKDFTYVAVTCLRRDEKEVEEALRAGGFAKPSSPGRKVPAEQMKELEEQKKALETEIDGLEKEIASFAHCRDELRLVSDYYRGRAEKYRVLGEIPQTQSTFGLSGYVPASMASGIADELSGKYDAAVEIEEIAEDEEPPVLLKNNAFGQTVEGILASFGLPHKGEIDPSLITAAFYVFFFGIMLSDAAYGVIVSLACGAVLLKFPRMGKSLRKSIQLFFWCGLSTLFWGVMFGGYFGDALEVVASTFFGVELSIPAVWFTPLDEPMRLLMFSMLFGLIHMFVGMGLKAYMCIKDGRWMDLICDVGFWMLFLLGLIGILLPTEMFCGMMNVSIVFPEAVNTAVKVMAVVGGLGLLFFSGRANKNPVMRIGLGAYDIYNITGWLSDVLSYSRLLALGLATGVIASVVNQMGSMFGSGIIGAVIFILVFIIGHLFNMAINLLGAYVHTCRLQYVEFFGKFYEGGGRAFAPFHMETKYVDFKEEKES